MSFNQICPLLPSLILPARTRHVLFTLFKRGSGNFHRKKIVAVKLKRRENMRMSWKRFSSGNKKIFCRKNRHDRENRSFVQVRRVLLRGKSSFRGLMMRRGRERRKRGKSREGKPWGNENEKGGMEMKMEMRKKGKKRTTSGLRKIIV